MRTDDTPVAENPEPQGLQKLVHLWRTSKTSLIGAGFMVAQPLLLNAISIPATAYIIKSLGPLTYGEWAVALSLIASTAVLLGLGARSTFVRRLSREPENAPDLFAEQLGLRIFLGGFAGAVSVAACIALGYSSIVVQCTALLALGGVFSAVAQVVADLLIASERLPSMSIINAIGGLSLTGASVLAIWFNTGPIGLAISYMFGPVLTAVLSLALVQRQLFSVRMKWMPRRWWALLAESKTFTLQLLVYGLDTQAVNLLVPKLVDVTSYGYFAAGTLVPTRLIVVPDGLNTAYFPVLVRHYGEGAASFRRSVRNFFLFTFLTCMAAAIPVYFLAGPVANLLFPEHPEVCKMLMQTTIWWLPICALYTGITNVLNASFRENPEARAAFAAMIVSMLVTVVLVAKWQLVGAAVALLIRGVINLLFRAPLFIRAMRSADLAVTKTPPSVVTEGV